MIIIIFITIRAIIGPFLSVRSLLPSGDLLKGHGVHIILTAVALSRVAAVSMLFLKVLAVIEGETAEQTFPVSL